MAEADPIMGALHPATARQAAYPAWTDDPAVARLFTILRDLHAAGRRLEALHRERPDLDAASAVGELGAVTELYERCPARAFRHGRRVRANGGACAALWQLLAARRDAWIAARLEAEGFAPFASSAAKSARIAALVDEAVPVDLAWTRLATGVFDFTPAADSPRVAAG